MGEVISSVSFRANASGVNGTRTKQVFTRFGWCEVRHPYRIGNPEESDVFKAFGIKRKMTQTASKVATMFAVTQGSFKEAKETDQSHTRTCRVKRIGNRPASSMCRRRRRGVRKSNERCLAVRGIHHKERGMRTLLKYTAQAARRRGSRRVSGAHDYSAPTRATARASRQSGKRQFRLAAVRGALYAASGLRRGKAG